MIILKLTGCLYTVELSESWGGPSSIETHNAVERFDDFDSDENVSVSTNINAVYIICS